MRTVVVCCDSVPVKLIGANGSEWVETPNLDRLAAEGVLYDSAFVDRQDLRGAVRGRLSRIRFVHIDQSEVSSGESLFAKAAEAWDALVAEDALLWIDVALGGGDWLPPSEWQGRHREEDDPEPIYERRAGPIAAAELERVASGWADRMAYFDATLGAFLQAIDEDAAEKPIVAFTAASGEALGEHGVAGTQRALHRENAQRPLILRHPNGPRSARRAALMNTNDIAEMIVELAEGGPASRLNPRSNAERWCIANRGSLTTRHWRLIENADGDAKLFALPEDANEMNDLASRAPDAVDNLRMALARFNEEANDDAG